MHYKQENYNYDLKETVYLNNKTTNTIHNYLWIATRVREKD